MTAGHTRCMGLATRLTVRTRAAAQGQTVQTAGYPADKPGTMWMQNCTDTDPVDYDYGYFYVECWVFYGQSGAGRSWCSARAHALAGFAHAAMRHS
jgi:V8-like Glu-specific endopeptidase